MNSICDGRKELFHQQMWYIPSPIIYFCIPNIHSFTWDIYGFSFTCIHKHQLKFFWVQMPSVPPPTMVSLISKTGSNSHNGISQTRGESGWTLEVEGIISGHDTVSLANPIHTQETWQFWDDPHQRGWPSSPPLHIAFPDNP